MNILSSLLSVANKSSKNYSSNNNGTTSTKQRNYESSGQNPYMIDTSPGSEGEIAKYSDIEEEYAKNTQEIERLEKKLYPENGLNANINYLTTYADSSQKFGIGLKVDTEAKKADEESLKTLKNFKGPTLNTLYSIRESESLKHVVDVPKWGYKDYLNERVSWLKGLDSVYGEPAFFYFKIFFKFDTQYGLFGGILNDESNNSWTHMNTAAKFFLLNRNMYAQEKMLHRYKALVKFVRSLSWISCKAPWFFNSVKDCNLGMTMHFENLTQKKTIEIGCLEDAIDMRLNTLFDFYKYACYDNVNMKEILPENLRKFDMDIVVFQAPLRYYQTSVRDLRNRTAYYKNMYDNDMNNRFSFKLFSFINCEFDYESLNTLMPSEFTNSTPFQSKPTFKINYDRVFTHTQNEYARVLLGDTGFLWDGQKDTESTDNHITIHQYANDHPNYHNSSSQVYKAMVDATESTIGSAMMILDGQATLGNLYGDESVGSAFKNAFSAIGGSYKSTAKNLLKSVTSW